VGVTPYLADLENADGKALAAVAATYGIAEDKEIDQIFGLQMRGTYIPRSACMAIDNHPAFLLLSEFQGDQAYFRPSYTTIPRVGIKTGKCIAAEESLAAELRKMGQSTECSRDESHGTSTGKPSRAQFAGHDVHGF
jgi:hypothetical protein